MKVSQRLIRSDDVDLHCDCYGDSQSPPIILSHGGGQTRHSWGNTAQVLANQGWYVINYDHRGHGDSAWSPDGVYQLGAFAKDLKAVIDDCAIKPIVVGASLGGLSAMICAGEIAMDCIKAVVLVDVTPELNQEGVNEIFSFMNEHMAEGFESLDHAADIIAQYTGRPKRSNNNGLEKNLRLRNGRYYWHWDPDFFSLREDSTATPQRTMQAVQKIDVPLLLVRGRMSNVVTEKEVDSFLKLAPAAKFVDVADAKHMVAGDKNDVFTAEVVSFIQGLT